MPRCVTKIHRHSIHASRATFDESGEFRPESLYLRFTAEIIATRVDLSARGFVNTEQFRQADDDLTDRNPLFVLSIRILEKSVMSDYDLGGTGDKELEERLRAEQQRAQLQARVSLEQKFRCPVYRHRSTARCLHVPTTAALRI